MKFMEIKQRKGMENPSHNNKIYKIVGMFSRKLVSSYSSLLTQFIL